METIILTLTGIAKTIGISPALLIAVCTTETNLKNVITYNDGATHSYGLCQVKLETAKFMGKVHNKPHLENFTEKDMQDIKNNAKIAALYLKYQLNRYGGDYCKATAAYNAGRFKESKDYPGKPFNWKYVKKVKNNFKNGKVEIQQSLECDKKLDYNFAAN
jgi:soluble lytic murein transglycosylase-like protein